uniref:Uncharacterized protein n=1 Tax=Anguilla anguilla TaxID=7936 RepID=A0A0E9XRX4_ANGAN
MSKMERLSQVLVELSDLFVTEGLNMLLSSSGPIC